MTFFLRKKRKRTKNSKVGDDHQSTTMFFNTSIILFIASVYCICLGEAKTLQEHTSQLADQESQFQELINGSEPYNRRLPPYDGEAVQVFISIYLYSMASFDELRTDYSMQILFRESWTDKRLEFRTDKLSKIVGDSWHAQQIWTPKMHVVNDNDFDSKTEKGEKVLVHINSDGKVLLSKRVKLKPYCKMEFYRYPMDKQQCTLQIESSMLSASDMELSWAKERPLDLNRNFVVPGFILTNYSLEQTVKSYLQTGNFSRIIVTFDLQREFGHFVLDIYIPSILFVVTSWLSFWVEIPAAPARVTLGMTTMLTLVTSEKAIREKLPKVSYIHALDVWNVVCTGFVFASLIQYALVNYIYHKDKRRRKHKGLKRAESTMTFSSVDSENHSSSRASAKKGEHLDPEMPNKKAVSLSSLSDVHSVSRMDMTCGWAPDEFKLTPQDIANGIDRKCRYLFPAGFMVFNVIYWLVLWL